MSCPPRFHPVGAKNVEGVARGSVSVLHFIPDEDRPAEVLATLLGALPAGSYLVASHITSEYDPEGWARIQRQYAGGGIPGQARDSSEFARLAFLGLDLVPPGVVPVTEWRPNGSGWSPVPAEVSVVGGVARKSARSPGGGVRSNKWLK